MKKFVVACALAAAFAALPLAAVAQPAFPGAEGFGANTIGGRGGRVIAVTNLNDDGPGSLRAAVAATGPRIVVFRVSGTIRLTRPLTIRNPNITIAGQTSLGGVTVRDYAFVIEADEVIVRYIRARLGDESRVESDAFSISRGRNIIVDHVSASWSVDETLSASARSTDNTPALDNVTVQWSIISESLNHSVHTKGDHGYGSLIRGSFGAKYSWHHNLWAHHRGRMPRPGNYESIETDPQGPLFDFVNNVFYNWAGSYSGYNDDQNSATRYNFIANYYIPGNASADRAVAFRERNRAARAYFAGNWWDNAEPSDPWSLVRLEAENPAYRSATRFETAPITTQRGDRAYQLVLANAGASHARDAVDRRVVQSVRDRTGNLIDSQSQAGGWSDPVHGMERPDTDNDGMDDAWERANGLEVGRDDSAGDRDNDGYTNIEEYVNSLATEYAP